MSKTPSQGILRRAGCQAVLRTLIIILLCGSQLAQAQMQADPNAAGNRRPVIDNTANGLPLVQIAAPNAAGLSHNQYQQFSVGKGGAILNNASGNSFTRLGGWVGGNPGLPGGGAKIILNEVTSTHPSALRGYLEVTGRRADVIVSNPNGILVEGAGFINTSRAILTTGTPVVGPGGTLDGFRVTQGAVRIGAGGFNDKATDQVDLIARSVAVNGKLHVNRLNVIAGTNQVSYAGLGVQVIPDVEGKPTVAIDIAELGGMFANAIHLIGTEAGVGVRSYGEMASSAGEFSIDSKGTITLTGDTTSAGNLAVASEDGINNSGTVYAQHNTTVASRGEILNSGTVAALGNTSLAGREINSTGSLGAGIDGAGALYGNGSLSVMAAQTLKATGPNLSARDLDFSGTALDLTGAITQAGGNARLTASTGGIFNKGGKLTAAGSMTARADGAFDNTDATTASGGALRIAAASLDNSRGSIGTGDVGTGDIRIDNSGKLTNAAGQIVSARHLAATAQTLVGNGQVRAMQDAAISLQGDYTQTAGNQLGANRDFSFSTTGTLTNEGILSGGRHAGVRAANIDNRSTGLINSNGTTLITAVNALTNTGKIYGDKIAIGAQSIDNTDGAAIAARDTLHAGTGRLVNSERALLKSDGDMAIGGALDAGHNATGSAGSVTNSSATIDSGGKLAIASAALLNTNAHFSSAIEPDPDKSRNWTEYEIDGSSRVYPDHEVHVSNESDIDKLVVNADGSRHNDYTRRIIKETTGRTVVLNSKPGQILSRGNMSLNGGTVTNSKSAIVAGGKLDAVIDGANNGGTNPQGEIFVHQEIESMHHWTDTDTWGDRDDRSDTRNLAVDLPVTHFDLGIWQVKQNTRPDSNRNPAQGQNVAATGSPGNVPALTDVAGSRTPQLSMPDNLLYIPAPSGLGYLIQSDPAFINYRNFLSSDYQLSRMGMNPQTAQKRLGDGYYEQKLVNDQILQLTGRKTLGAYASNEDQFRALLEAGVTYARQFQLLPGMSLSAAQMAALTSDLVWLVEQNMMLADGSVQKVLAPVVYLSQLHAQDVRPTGAVIVAGSIELRLNGSLLNAGTLKADSTLIVHAAQDINNTFGTISSDSRNGTTILQAGRDFNNQSGSISGNRVGILTGRDLNSGTLAHTTTGAAGTQTGLDKTGGINAATLTAQAQRDINFSAAGITTTGDAAFAAGRNFNATAVTTQAELNVTYDDKNHLYQRQEQVNGTVITTGGNASFTADNDISTEAAYVNAGKRLTAGTGNNLSIGAASQRSSYDQEIYTASSGILSSKSAHSKDKQNSTQAIGSVLSGETVTAQAGNKLSIAGSNVVAQDQLSLSANNALIVSSTQNTDQRQYQKTETRSGVFTGGNRLHMGKQITDTDTVQRSVANNASTLGSVQGSIALNAGGDASLTGVQLQARQNIDVSGRNVSISATVDTFDARSTTTVTTSGVRIGAKSSISDAAMALRQATNRGQEVNDPRLKALYAAKAAYAASDLAQIVRSAQASKGATASGKLSIGIGTTVEQRTSTSHVETVNKAQAAAGGNVNINAKGDSTPDHGDIRLKGAGLNGDSITLDAVRDITAGSQAATSSSTDTYKKLDLEAGLYAGGSLGGGGGKGGFGLYGSVDYQQSKTELSGTTHTETTVDAAHRLTSSSGRDTTLTGTVATAGKIDATIGRNLTMTSEQDSDRYRQQQLGGQLEGRYAFGNDSGVSGYLSYSKTQSDYRSVQEQTALNAGQGGYTVNVGGHTQLNGARLDSQATANRNKLATATLAATDLRNEASYSAISANVSFGNGGGGMGGGIPSLNPLDSLTPGMGVPAGDKKDSITQSAIAPGAITVRQDQQSGQDSTRGISRDTANANKPLERIFDANKVAEQQELGRVLGEVGNRAIGDLSRKLNLKDGSPEKMALHAALGALQAGAAGGNALAGAAAAAGTEWIGTSVAQYLGQNASLQPSQKQAIQQWAALMTGAAIGGVAGGNGYAALAGGAASLDAERYNRQLHQTEKDRIKQLANGDAKKEERLTAAACAAVSCWAEYASGTPEFNYYKAMADWGNTSGLAVERDTLAQQTVMFDYSYTDKVSDFTKWLGNSAIQAGKDATKLIEQVVTHGPNTLPQTPLDLPNDQRPPSGTAAVVVTPPVLVCVPPACVMTPPVIIPANAIASTAGNGGEKNGETTNSQDSSLLDNKATTHTLDGDSTTSGGHRYGTGNPGKTEFPQSWSDQKITNIISDIVTDPMAKWSKPDARGYISVTSTRDGVDVKVIFDTKNNRIVTGYPTNLLKNSKP